MGSSPDVSGSRGLGRPQSLDFTEQQQTAETAMNKQALVLTKNTLDVPFTQMGGERFQYQAHSTKPTLQQTLFVAMVRTDKPLSNELSKKIFEELKEKLPLQLQMGLKHYSGLPWEERPVNFILLELLLQFAAKALAFLEVCKSVEEPLEIEKTAKYQMLTKQSILGWEKVATGLREEFVILSKGFKSLDEDARASAENVKILTPYLKHVRGLIKSEGKTRETILKKTAKALKIDLEQIRQGKFHGITEATTNSLEMLQALLAAEQLEKGKALYHCLYLGGMSYFSKGEKCLGPTLQELVKRGSDEYGAFFGSYLCTFAMVSFVPTVVAASHLKHLEAKEEERFEKSAFQALALKMASTLISNSSALETLLQILVEPLRMDSKEKFVALASSCAYTVLPLNAYMGKMEVQNAEAMLTGVQRALRENLKLFSDNANVKQARIATKKREPKGFFEALFTGVKELKIDPTNLSKECAEITEEAKGLLEGLEDMSLQQKFMDVIRQVA